MKLVRKVCHVRVEGPRDDREDHVDEGEDGGEPQKFNVLEPKTFAPFNNYLPMPHPLLSATQNTKGHLFSTCIRSIKITKQFPPKKIIS